MMVASADVIPSLKVSLEHSCCPALPQRLQHRWSTLAQLIVCRPWGPVLGHRWLAGYLCGLENQWRKPRPIPRADSGDALCAAHLPVGHQTAVYAGGELLCGGVDEQEENELDTGNFVLQSATFSDAYI